MNPLKNDKYNRSSLRYSSTFSVSAKCPKDSTVRPTCILSSGVIGLTNAIVAISNLSFTNNTSSSNNTIYNGDVTTGAYNSSTGQITITGLAIHKSEYTITMSGTVYLIG